MVKIQSAEITIALITDMGNLKHRLVQILSNIRITQRRKVHFKVCCLEYGLKINLQMKQNYVNRRAQ